MACQPQLQPSQEGEVHLRASRYGGQPSRGLWSEGWLANRSSNRAKKGRSTSALRATVDNLRADYGAKVGWPTGAPNEPRRGGPPPRFALRWTTFARIMERRFAGQPKLQPSQEGEVHLRASRYGGQ